MATRQLKDENRVIWWNSLMTSVGVGAGVATCYLLYARFRKTPPVINKQDVYAQMFRAIQKANPTRTELLEPLTIQKSATLKGGSLQLNLNLVTRLTTISTVVQTKNPFLPPFQKGRVICDLGTNHRLMFNRFNFYRNHLLIITKEFRSQLERLSREDFEQAIHIYRALDGLFYYNRGPKSGASQPHKHFQTFPKQAKKLPIYSKMEQFARNLNYDWNMNSPKVPIHKFPHFDFRHGLVVMPRIAQMREDHKIFAEHMKRAEQALHSDLIGNKQQLDYNVIGSDQFLFMVPRKQNIAYGLLNVNSIGFMGSVFLKNEQNFQAIQNLNLKPQDIFEKVTFKDLVQ